MADVPPEPGEEKSRPSLRLPSWKKIAEFLSNIGQLERSVKALENKNKNLEEQVSRLQRQADDQAGQLKVLTTFVQTSLRDQVETRAEKAAIRVFERLIAIQGDETPDDER
jgi:predicted RNase H-like nuclease (RuvC/YqgF family)